MPKIEINITGNGPMMGQQIAGMGCCPHCLDREPQSASSIGVLRSHPALARSAVDAMLKKRGYETGSLYARIDKALADNLLTKRMADWAHEVRLGSNRPRHADKDKPHVSASEAAQSVEFAEALGNFPFVLTNAAVIPLLRQSASTATGPRPSARNGAAIFETRRARLARDLRSQRAI
jgi:hypothetical protein